MLNLELMTKIFHHVCFFRKIARLLRTITRLLYIITHYYVILRNITHAVYGLICEWIPSRHELLIFLFQVAYPRRILYIKQFSNKKGLDSLQSISQTMYSRSDFWKDICFLRGSLSTRLLYKMMEPRIFF